MIPKIITETEENFANFIKSDNAILVNSGTAALHTAYLACGIGPGDEVIVPAFTYYATVNMIIACGATPVFVDINPLTYLIDVNDVIRKFNERTKAIIVVNLFGKELSGDEFKELDLGAFIIIDSAQCVKPDVNYGDIQCFSFYRTKNFSCFEGGAITTNNSELATQCRIIMSQGEDTKYNTIRLGFNYRISDLQAVMLNHQIMYHFIGGNSELGRFSPKDGHYPRVVYEQPFYKDLGYYDKFKGTCPIAEELARKVRNNEIDNMGPR
jgi:perosamine synthetase